VLRFGELLVELRSCRMQAADQELAAWVGVMQRWCATWSVKVSSA
jgi:hypothetical protein